jgi:hypothetical protein
MFQGLDEQINAMENLLKLNRVPVKYVHDEHKFVVEGTDYAITLRTQETPMRAWISKGDLPVAVDILYSGNPTSACIEMGNIYRREFRDRLAQVPGRFTCMKPASNDDLNRLLRTGCPWKSHDQGRCVVLSLVSSAGLDFNYEDGNSAFHPDGCSGLLLADDEAVFGIRCNHLIWMTGNHDSFGPSVLFVGNHKGSLSMSVMFDSAFIR